MQRPCLGVRSSESERQSLYRKRFHQKHLWGAKQLRRNVEGLTPHQRTSGLEARSTRMAMTSCATFCGSHPCPSQMTHSCVAQWMSLMMLTQGSAGTPQASCRSGTGRRRWKPTRRKRPSSRRDVRSNRFTSRRLGRVAPSALPEALTTSDRPPQEPAMETARAWLPSPDLVGASPN